MTSHQDLVLKRLRDVARDAGQRPVDTSISSEYTNRGRLIVSLAANLATVVTADFDFQHRRVYLVLDHAGGMLSAPRDDRHFHWTPGKPEDNDELDRLVSVWRQTIRERTAR